MIVGQMRQTVGQRPTVTHVFRTVVGADGWEGTANDVSCVRCRYQINPDGTPAV